MQVFLKNYGDRFSVKFPFNMELNEYIKSIKGYKYVDDKKLWFLPISALDELCNKFKRYGCQLHQDEKKKIRIHKFKRCFRIKDDFNKNLEEICTQHNGVWLDNLKQWKIPISEFVSVTNYLDSNDYLYEIIVKTTKEE